LGPIRFRWTPITSIAGQQSSVKYQSLAPRLLNEVQQQNAELQLQQDKIQKLQDHPGRTLEAMLSGQTPALTKAGELTSTRGASIIVLHPNLRRIRCS